MSDGLAVRDSHEGKKSWSKALAQVVARPSLTSTVLVDRQDWPRLSPRCGPLTSVWLAQTAIDFLTFDFPITTSLRPMVTVRW